jgi:pyruvate kinase
MELIDSSTVSSQIGLDDSLKYNSNNNNIKNIKNDDDIDNNKNVHVHDEKIRLQVTEQQGHRILTVARNGDMPCGALGERKLKN